MSQMSKNKNKKHTHNGRNVTFLLCKTPPFLLHVRCVIGSETSTTSDGLAVWKLLPAGSGRLAWEDVTFLGTNVGILEGNIIVDTEQAGRM